MKHPLSQPLGHLTGWDVIAAILGLAATLGVLVLQPPNWSYRIIWIGGPALFIAARRRFLPQLSPAREAPATPPSALRRAFGFVLMIGGGFVGVFAGIFAGVFWVVGMKGHGFAWDYAFGLAASLGVFAGAVWVMILGMRRAR